MVADGAAGAGWLSRLARATGAGGGAGASATGQGQRGIGSEIVAGRKPDLGRGVLGLLASSASSADGSGGFSSQALAATETASWSTPTACARASAPVSAPTSAVRSRARFVARGGSVDGIAAIRKTCPRSDKSSQPIAARAKEPASSDDSVTTDMTQRFELAFSLEAAAAAAIDAIARLLRRAS